MRAVPPRERTIGDPFAYAKDLATFEIDSIDRLHKRTLTYLSVFATVFAIVGFSLGYLGYRNLADSVQTQVKLGVDAKIREELQAANVELTIRKILRERSEDQIRGIVRDQVTSAVVPEVRKQLQPAVALTVRANSAQLYSTIHSEVITQIKQQAPLIRDTAVTETQRITKEQLDIPQSGTYSTITGFLQQDHPARIQIAYNPQDASARQWIIAVRKAGWEVLDDPNGAAISSGLPGSFTIVDDPQNPSTTAIRIDRAFRRDGQKIQIIGDNVISGLSRPAPNTPILIVHSK